ncbi:MAG: fibronectin type III domain-containing protein [Candidatus Pacebacteria bacterium]|nr:fibronectin type III domain-containing protein [Candidatus Paceibacterota bacterium]
MQNNNKKLYKIFFILSIPLLFCDFCQFVMAADDSVDVNQSVYFEEAPGGGAMLPVDATPPEIFDVKIYDITSAGAKISWQTDEVCLVEVYYGEDASVLSGPLTDHPESYLNFHNFRLTGLEPGTKYYLKLKSKNQKGAEKTLTGYSFTTVPEFIAPANIGDLRIEQVGESISISWQNPQSKDFSGVQINKKINSPAINPAEGEIVFSGLAENFTDRDIEDKTKYYYTVFSYDQNGNFSSGVIGSFFVDFKTGGTDVGGGNEGDKDGGMPDTPENPENVPGDVEDIEIVPDSGNEKIIIKWKNPESEDALQIEIRRDSNFPPPTPYEGELIYSGSGDSFEDFFVEENQIYYYSIFTKNSEGVYSSGKMIASSLEGEVKIDFDEEWKRIGVFDTESGISLLLSGDIVKTFPARSVGVSYEIDILPEEVKMVAAEMDGSLYLLDYEEESKSYKTSFVAPQEIGIFSVAVVFVNFQDKIIYRKEIKIEVVGFGRIYENQWKNFSEDGFNSDVLGCYFRKIFRGNAYGCTRKVVIEGAEIEIFRENSLIEWELWNADLFGQQNPSFSSTDGNFGFIIENGNYKIVVKKDGFADRILIVDIVDNLIKNDIEIVRQKYGFYAIMTVIILLILFAIKLKKRSSKKKDI